MAASISASPYGWPIWSSAPPGSDFSVAASITANQDRAVMGDNSFKRIVIACDASTENRVAIETGASLAARLNASVHGVFVEDAGLLDLAGLPFARQFSETL